MITCFKILNPEFLLLMAEIQRLPVEGQVVLPIIYRVLYIPGGCLGFQPSTVSSSTLNGLLLLGLLLICLSFLSSAPPHQQGWAWL